MTITSRFDQNGTSKTMTKPINVRFAPEMHREIEEFYNNGGYDTFSDAIRVLMAAGLESEVGQNPQIYNALKDNGRAYALRRLDYCMSHMMELFRSSTPIEGLDT